MATLSEKSDLHLARKVWHMTTGLLMVWLYLGSDLGRTNVTLILGCVLAGTLVVEILRLRVPAVSSFINKIMGPLMRNHEATRFSGTTYYALGVFIAVAVFPQPVAVLGLLYLACGDPVASIFGILYGERGIRFKNGKSLVGTVAGVLTCLVVSVVYLGTLSLTATQFWSVALVGSVAGGCAEFLTGKVDDNLLIPVVSGGVLWGAFAVLAVQ